MNFAELKQILSSKERRETMTEKLPLMSAEYRRGYRDGQLDMVEEWRRGGTVWSNGFPSGVYLIRRGEHIKIGFSCDVIRRFQALRSHSPGQCEAIGFVGANDEEQARKLELELHARFDHLRIAKGREWFKDDGSIAEFATACEQFPAGAA